MKIFLVSTPKGGDKLGDIFQKLYHEVEVLGYTHTNNLITTQSQEFETKMKKGEGVNRSFYKEMSNAIQQADICIFEASTPSFGVGYLIQESLTHSKPTIVLFYKEPHSHLLTGVEDEKLIVEKYDKKNYRKVLSQAISKAREKRDKRFNFFLSPKLLQYIDDASKKRDVTKSKLLRDMIVKHMRENPTD